MAITPLWFAGLETGLKEFSNTGESPTISTTSKKTGVYALRIGTSGGYGDINLSTSQARVGLHISPTSNYATTYEASIFRFRNGTTTLLGVNIDDSGTTLNLVVNGSVVATTTPPTYNVWQHWGVDWKVDATAGWAKFYIDGQLVLSYDGNTGITAATYARIGANGINVGFTNYTYIDDIYIDDTTGEGAPLPPPDKRYPYYIPVTDVTKTFTPSTGTDHRALLDEIPVSATDYVSTLATGSVDTFTVSPTTALPAGFETAAVWPVAFAFKDNSEVDSRLTFRVSDGITDDDGASIALPTTQGLITERFALQPDFGNWNNADVLTMAFGFVSSGTL